MPERHTDFERWEAFFMMVLMATRPIIFIGGLILLIYGLAAFLAYPVVGLVAIGLAFLVWAVVFLDQAALYLARFGAWIKTR